MHKLSRKESKQASISRAKKRELKLKQVLLDTGLILPSKDSKDFGILYAKLAKGQNPSNKKALKRVMLELERIQAKSNLKGELRVTTSRRVFEQAGKDKRSYEMGRYYSKV